MRVLVAAATVCVALLFGAAAAGATPSSTSTRPPVEVEVGEAQVLRTRPAVAPVTPTDALLVLGMVGLLAGSVVARREILTRWGEERRGGRSGGDLGDLRHLAFVQLPASRGNVGRDLIWLGRTGNDRGHLR